jgi:uncharacterized protein
MADRPKLRGVPNTIPRPRVVACLLLAFVCTLGVHAVSAQDFPDPVGRVNDFANVLDPALRRTLEGQLAELERATTAQVALVTMNTLGDRQIEPYSLTLFNRWGIGQKDKNNGVLVLVVVQDKVMRIAVGYGMEGILPTSLCEAICRDTFVPHFRKGDYKTGMIKGMARVMEIVRRNEIVTADQRLELAQDAAEAGKSWGMIWLFGTGAAICSFLFGTAAGAKVVSQLLFGLAFTCGVIYFSAYVVPWNASLLLASMAVVIATVGFVLGRRPKWRRRIRGMGAGAGGSGWLADGTSSSSSSSDSSDSGSSSFGGGSSGGGGGTGHW